MALIERLMGLETPKMHVHQFMAALGEIERSKMTAQQAVNGFSLNTEEQTEATSLIAKIVSPLETIAMGGFLTLTNVGTAYDSINAAVGLGFCRIECAGITAFEFRIGMNRNGSAGTVSWQLWDETNSVEAARIDDASGAGNKFVQTQQSVGPLAAGIRIFRVRCKSTTGTDDPIYYGSNLLLRRVGIMTSETLHEVLLLAESRMAPYDSASAVRTRLGL